MIFIVADNNWDFRRICKELKVNPVQAVNLNHPQKYKGVRDVEIYISNNLIREPEFLGEIKTRASKIVMI